jgi:hypothetical protein
MLDGEVRWVDETTAAIFSADWQYYALLAPACIPAILFFSFLTWFGREFFINN